MLCLVQIVMKETIMGNRAFSELPANYQQGLLDIETQCKAALARLHLSVDKIEWDKIGLMACHLIIHAFNRRFDTKFGKLAIVSADDPHIQRIIDCKLQFLVDKLVQARRRCNIKK